MSVSKDRPALELMVEFAVVHTYQLENGQQLIGRGDESGIKLNDTAVSTRHATVTVMESPDFPGYFETMLEDIGSKNGTKVNGEPVRSCQLQHGDMVSIGHTQLRYIEPGGIETTETGVMLTD